MSCFWRGAKVRNWRDPAVDADLRIGREGWIPVEDHADIYDEVKAVWRNPQEINRRAGRDGLSRI
jgi:hypothetical protein